MLVDFTIMFILAFLFDLDLRIKKLEKNKENK